MSNRSETGDYYRRIIKLLEYNIESLENERIKYGRFKRFVKGIDKNLKSRRKDLEYYNNLLNDYIKNDWAE